MGIFVIYDMRSRASEISSRSTIRCRSPGPSPAGLRAAVPRDVCSMLFAEFTEKTDENEKIDREQKIESGESRTETLRKRKR